MANPNHSPIFNPQVNRAEDKRAPGAPSTIDDDFSARQYSGALARNAKLEPAANDNQATVGRSFNPGTSPQPQKNKLKLPKRPKVSEVSKAVLKAKVWSVNLRIYYWCFFLYLAQLVGWLIIVVGLALEVGAVQLGEVLGLGFFGSIAADATSAAVPGLSIAWVGYVLAVFFAMLQLGVAVSFYKAGRINAFGGEAGFWFKVIAAWYWLPIVGGFWPAGLLWTLKVADAAGE